jgi:hypothetical protein
VTTPAGYTPFVDVTGSNFSRVPLVAGHLYGLYATGSAGIEETAAQLAAVRAAGAGYFLYDQTPSLSVFAAGLAQAADIEQYAGTAAAAHTAVAARQSRGEPSVLYCSYSSLAGLAATISSPAGVTYGVADYSWSDTQAEGLLAANGDWSYCQYGDPASNPATVVPGSAVTLQQAQADINVAKAGWAAQFLPGAPPPPAPVPPAPVPPASPAPGLPYYANGSRELAYRPGTPAAAWMRGTDVLYLQKFISATLEDDGIYGPETAEAVSGYEKMRGISQEVPYGICGPEVWRNILGG